MPPNVSKEFFFHLKYTDPQHEKKQHTEPQASATSEGNMIQAALSQLLVQHKCGYGYFYFFMKTWVCSLALYAHTPATLVLYLFASTTETKSLYK